MLNVDKVSKGLALGSEIDHAVRNGSVAVQVRFLEGVSLGAALTELRKNGFEFDQPKAFLFNNWLNATATTRRSPWSATR
mgnify:CR=1 FL=1